MVMCLFLCPETVELFVCSVLTNVPIVHHFAAENIAFMYSLLESCKLNNVNFGEYVEDILTRLMKGEKGDMSFLPNKYVPRPKEELDKAA